MRYPCKIVTELEGTKAGLVQMEFRAQALRTTAL